MTPIKSYRDLIVWQKGMALVKDIYLTSQAFPKEELYGLTSQIRKCAVSIPSNIAEGYGRNSTGDYKRFLQIANGSLYELQTQIQIALDLNYISQESFNKIFNLSIEIDKILYTIIQKLK
jgi:four helix bundle protein